MVTCFKVLPHQADTTTEPRDKSAPSAADFGELLRAGEGGLDDCYDVLLPAELRQMSRVHWTPIDVTRRALRLLQPHRGQVFLDIGSGSGKFCIVASLMCDATFCGVEQRPQLVETSTRCARELGADRATFIHSDAFILDWRGFDGVYLYNPFGEQLCRDADWVDGTVAERTARHAESVERTREKLMGMPLGARVVLYHGFGGIMPRGYERVLNGVIRSGALELWGKSGLSIRAA